MNVDLERLVLLQAQDLELKHYRDELAAAPKRVAAAEAARAQAAKVLQSIRDSLIKEEALRRRYQSDVEDRRSKIARLGRQLDAAASTAQVSAYKNEIAFAEQAISKFEDDELSSMERTEALEAEQIPAQRDVDRTTAALEAARINGAVITERNNAAISRTESERKSLRAEIASTDAGERVLSTYDRIAKSRGSGVSEALDHKCSACQMMVRPQRWNDLTGREHKDEIFHCETCGRILFWDPRRDVPGSWPAGERLASARQLS